MPMSRLLCCLCARHADMGAALSQPQEGEACDGAGLPAAPPTMADVIRERKKKAGGAGLGTLRRRIAAAARRPRDHRPDRGCEHARYIRSIVSSWRLAEVFVLCEELEAGAALRDLVTQAELAREPAAALHADLAAIYRDRWWCDVELVGGGGSWSVCGHRAVLAARCTYLRELLHRYNNSSRVPLEGLGASLSRADMSAGVAAMYAGATARPRNPLCTLCAKWDRGGNDGDLDIINVDNTASCGRSSVSSSSCCACVSATTLSTLAALLGFTPHKLHTDMRYLLDSGELCDARLVFRGESCSGSNGNYGFMELPCHRVVLAARSRFFRSVMSRRSGNSGVVCVDEKVLPRRFARALLHAAYTDQVDLNLIGRSSSSPSSTNSTGNGTTSWAGVTRSSGRTTSTSTLDDAFQLYEIARFLEMPIVVQGCEDAIVEALSAETLPHVLRWAAAPHASKWVHRQAMRYLRDEFPSIMSCVSSTRLPRPALAEALASPFLQASEPQALRALLRWAERVAAAKHPDHREPNVVWHTAHTASVCRRATRRRDVNDAAVRELLAPLIQHLRVEHIPPDHDLLQQAIRRGIVSPPPAMDSADAWLGRRSCRSARCFLPYLDEIKALLEDQAVPEAELARARRARFLNRIPDTLYMVAAARNSSTTTSSTSGTVSAAAAAWAACVSPRALAACSARVAELVHAPPALRAAQQHRAQQAQLYTQIALRAVREMSLPDECAELLLAEMEANERAERNSGEWESPAAERRDRTWNHAHNDNDCCRRGGSANSGSAGSVRCSSASSVRASSHADTAPPLHPAQDRHCCTRDTNTHHRHSSSSSRPRTDARISHSSLTVNSSLATSGSGSGNGGSSGSGGRLSAAVPDVAMAPNANTHLLTARDYFRHPPPWEYSGGGVLQLDLGDGATHTPRPGSRAQRAAHTVRQRDTASTSLAAGCVRDDAELRAAIEREVIRAYSSFHPRAPSPPYPHLPHHQPQQLHQQTSSQSQPIAHASRESRSTASGSGTLERGSASAGVSREPGDPRVGVSREPGDPRLGVSAVLASAPPPPSPRLPDLHPHAHHLSLTRAGSSGSSSSHTLQPSSSGLRTLGPAGGLTRSRTPSPSPRPSPRRLRPEYALYTATRHDYRSDRTYGLGSRGPSPSDYA